MLIRFAHVVTFIIATAEKNIDLIVDRRYEKVDNIMLRGTSVLTPPCVDKFHFTTKSDYIYVLYGNQTSF